jgi:hypothetical protein
MKKFKVILLVIVVAAFFLTSINQLWAEAPAAKKKLFLHFVLTLDDQNKITGVEALDRQTGGLKSIPVKTEPVTGVKGEATLQWFATDDPCVTQGGIKWCW